MLLCEEEEEEEEGRETNGPISFLKRRFSSPFIKREGRGILFDWLITRGIHHRPAPRRQFHAAILDNLLGWDDKEVTVAVAPARPFIILGN